MRRTILIVQMVAVCVLAVATPARPITGGTPDFAHPNAGAVLASVDWDGPEGPEQYHLEFMCSGSLLTPTSFLTVGHCASLLGLEEIDGVYVTFDQDLLSEGLPMWWVGDVQTTPVLGWDIQPGFKCSASSCSNDLAVLTLGEAVADIPPIQVPDFGFLDDRKSNGGLVGHEFVSVGYGIGEPDKSLYNPNVTYPWLGERERSTSRYMALTRNDLFLLMNSAVGYGGVCAGDSGSPVYFEASGGSYGNLVVGVASFVDPNCNAVSGQERLDNADAQEFLAPFLEG